MDDINKRLATKSAESGHQFDSLQANSEGEIIDRLHAARKDGTAFMIVNFGGFTHTSIAIRDAILASEIPFIEVHLSNLFSREAYRHHSYFSDIAVGCVIGLGAHGYELALQAACKKLAN